MGGGRSRRDSTESPAVVQKTKTEGNSIGTRVPGSGWNGFDQSPLERSGGLCEAARVTRAGPEMAAGRNPGSILNLYTKKNSKNPKPARGDVQARSLSLKAFSNRRGGGRIDKSK